MRGRESKEKNESPFTLAKQRNVQDDTQTSRRCGVVVDCFGRDFPSKSTRMKTLRFRLVLSSLPGPTISHKAPDSPNEYLLLVDGGAQHQKPSKNQVLGNQQDTGFNIKWFPSDLCSRTLDFNSCF
jgi:hypothetical protein